MFSEDQV